MVKTLTFVKELYVVTYDHPGVPIDVKTRALYSLLNIFSLLTIN